MTRVRMLVCGVIVTVGLAVPSAQTPAVQSLDGKAGRAFAIEKAFWALS